MDPATVTTTQDPNLETPPATEPTPEVATPEAEEKTLLEERKPVPWKSFAAQTARKNSQIDTLETELAALKAAKADPTPVVAVPTAPAAGSAQEILFQTVQKALDPLKAEVAELREATATAQTRSEFSRHRTDFSQHITENFPTHDPDILRLTQEFVDTALNEKGEVVDPMIVYRQILADSIMNPGSSQVVAAAAAVANASEANLAAGSGGRGVTPPAVPVVTEDKPLGEMTSAEIEAKYGEEQCFFE